MPEVEPLSEARWARIEESLMQRLEELPSHGVSSHEGEKGEKGSDRGAPVGTLRAGRRLWPVALVAAFAVSAAAAVALRVARPPIGASSSRVVTEASASHVTIAETSLDVSPESGIEVREEEHATVLTLERGEVSLHVAPREKDRPFLVEAGDVHVRVVGTEFTVRRVGVGATVAVRRGVVEVREHGELATLRAGDHWPDYSSPLAANTNAVAPTSVASVTAPALPTPVALATPAVTPTPAANTPAAAAAPPTPRPAMRTRIAAASSPAPGPAPAPTTTPAPVPPPEESPASLATVDPTAQSKYETAARIERTDPTRALHLYTELAQGSDAWAQNALYAAGRLQADRGARTDAARLLEEYLRRFPRGSNAQDARALRESLR